MDLSDACAIDPQKVPFRADDRSPGYSAGGGRRPARRDPGGPRPGGNLHHNRWLRVFGFGRGPEPSPSGRSGPGGAPGGHGAGKAGGPRCPACAFYGLGRQPGSDLKPGDILLPRRALSEEGTSRLYRPGAGPRPAPAAWARTIAEALNEGAGPAGPVRSGRRTPPTGKRGGRFRPTTPPGPRPWTWKPPPCLPWRPIERGSRRPADHFR